MLDKCKANLTQEGSELHSNYTSDYKLKGVTLLKCLICVLIARNCTLLLFQFINNFKAQKNSAAADLNVVIWNYIH